MSIDNFISIATIFASILTISSFITSLYSFYNKNIIEKDLYKRIRKLEKTDFKNKRKKDNIEMELLKQQKAMEEFKIIISKMSSETIPDSERKKLNKTLDDIISTYNEIQKEGKSSE